MINSNSLVCGDIEKLGFKYLGAISFDKNLENSIGIPSKLLRTKFMNEFENILESSDFYEWKN